MSSLNKVQIIWNLTSNPKVKETVNWQKVATFSVATNRVWKDKSWMKQEEVEFHNIVAWQWLAEIADKYMNKGKKVYVEGYLKTRNLDYANGVKLYKTEIVADNVILLWENRSEKTENKESKYGWEEIDIDSIPF